MKESIPTVMRGFAVLEQIVLAKHAISAADLLQLLPFSKATLYRILQQLEDEGLVFREPVNRHYLPSSRTRDFTFGMMSNVAITTPRHAVLASLSRQVGETCNCSMLVGEHSVYFDRVETNWPFRIQLAVGSKLPLHCTASGKLLMAHLPESLQEKVISAISLDRYTPSTIVDRDQLRLELTRIKEAGIGIDNEEYMQGMVAIAVPVLDKQNRACFTVAMHAPNVRKSVDALYEYLPHLREAADKMAELELSDR